MRAQQLGHDGAPQEGAEEGAALRRGRRARHRGAAPAEHREAALRQERERLGGVELGDAEHACPGWGATQNA